MNCIDIVIIWVDGNDRQWREEKNKYLPTSNADDREHRYREWGNLQYWFRGIEKFAPWARKIHFVTWGHIPKWLNVYNEKINIVTHNEFIPQEYLPTFSSHVIELNLHRIKDLADKFVYFNDDIFLVSPTSENDFFVNNMPCDTAVLNVHCNDGIDAIFPISFNTVGVINKHFNSKNSIKKNFWKWFNIKNGFKVGQNLVLLQCPRFPGFWQHHLCSAYLKSTLEEVWGKEYDTLNDTCKRKFRSTLDINQWVFKEWQLAKGEFYPRSHKFGSSIHVKNFVENPNEISNIITSNKYKCICINDGILSDTEFHVLKNTINYYFEKMLGNKSNFEI